MTGVLCDDGSIGAINGGLDRVQHRVAPAGGPHHRMQPTAHCAAADAGRSAVQPALSCPLARLRKEVRGRKADADLGRIPDIA